MAKQNIFRLVPGWRPFWMPTYGTRYDTAVDDASQSCEWATCYRLQRESAAGRISCSWCEHVVLVDNTMLGGRDGFVCHSTPTRRLSFTEQAPLFAMMMMMLPVCVCTTAMATLGMRYSWQA